MEWATGTHPSLRGVVLRYEGYQERAAGRVGDLVGELGWSHRRLIARYRDVVGLPPKLVARIVRFERLTAQLATAPAADWADMVTTCGYFDQAHLAREVRELADVTPTELRAQTANFVQDVGARSA